MFKLPKKDKKYLSFLFSDTTINVAKVEEKNNNKRLSVYFQYPLPPNLIVNSEVKDSAKLAAIIKEIRLKINVPDTLVVIGLSEVKASVHTLYLPQLTIEETTQAIEHQADTFLPFPYQNEYVDWMYLNSQVDDHSTILINAIPKLIVDNYVIAFTQAGLKPVAIESTALPILRLVPENDRKNCLIAEISDSMTIIVINSDGWVETSLVAADNSQFLDSIKKILDYYYKYNQVQKEKEEPIKIYLCGKGVTNEIFAQIQQLKGQPVLIKSGIGGITPQQDMQIAVAVSLAEKLVSPTKDAKTINILPPELNERYRAIRQQAQTKKLNITLILIFIFLNFIVFGNLFSLKLKSDKLTVQAKSNAYGQLNDLERYNRKSILINQISSDNEIIQKTLKEITQPSQPNIQITSFSYSQQAKEFTLSGWTQSKENLIQYELFLEKSKMYTKVSIPISSLQEEINLNFQLILKL